MVWYGATSVANPLHGGARGDKGLRSTRCPCREVVQSPGRTGYSNAQEALRPLREALHGVGGTKGLPAPDPRL